MPIRFILGRAGSGKTTYCVDAILKALGDEPLGPPLILLVPDQATYQMERLLLERSGLYGFTRVFPLSFRRLAYRVFAEIGESSLPALDDVTRQMFLVSVLEEVKDGLRVFRHSRKEPGLLQTLSRTLKEFKRYGKTPEDIRSEFERLEKEGLGESLLALKLRDLDVIYRVFEQTIEGRFLDGEGSLGLLARRLHESRWVRASTVWVDGFSGFTPDEYEVLVNLARHTRGVHVSLCLDSRSIPETLEDLHVLSPFYPTEESYLQIVTRLSRDVKRLAAVRLDDGRPPRFGRSPSLAFLEKELFSPGRARFPGPPGGIHLIEAADRRTEVRAVARTIARLVRDEGYRYRDIAVVLRDLGQYSDLIRPVFGEYGIPYFIDERRRMAHHPLVELVRSAVRAVATGWAAEPVLQYLKTDLLPVGREEIDEVENYALAFGVRGSEWTTEEPWRRRTLGVEDDERIRPEEEQALERIDRARREALTALADFHGRVAGGRRSVREVTAALYRLLVTLGVAERLRSWAADSRAARDPGRADEHGDAWQGVVDLLQNLVDALGDEVLSLPEYATVLEAGLSQLTLGLIPPSLDQVTVGSIERSRHPALRAAFVLGVGEGAFPRAKAEDPIFTDGERETLRERGFDLAPGARRELLRERYFGYIAFTRPREKLWISYPVSDDQGRELLPSVFVRRLREVFTDLAVTRVDRDEPLEGPGDVLRVTDLAALAAAGARKPLREVRSEWWAGLYDQALEDPEIRESLGHVLRALSYSNQARLPEAAARDLYGAVIRTGVTSLEKFAACPFRYFGEKGLNLLERPTPDLEPVDLGSLYHEVLRRFFVKTRDEGLRWAEMDPAHARRIMDEELDAVVSRLGVSLQSSARNRALVDESRRSLGDLVEGLLFHFRRTDFEPVAAEQDFGGLEIDLGRERSLQLRGRIDRIDAIPGTDPLVVRVVDYKTRGRTLDLWAVEEGLALQLTAYLLTVRERSRQILGRDSIEPAGCFFAPVLRGFESHRTAPAAGEDPEAALKGYQLRGAYSEAYAGNLDREVGESAWSPTHAIYVKKGGGLGNLRNSDYLPEGHLDALIRQTREQLRNLALGILSGAVDIRPYEAGKRNACSFCPLRAVCRFEPWRNRYRRIEVRDRSAVIESLGQKVR